MDGSPPENLYHQERRRRLAAERTLERTRHELSRAHSALVANADRLSLRYLSERETNLRLSDRQKQVLEQRKEAADKADRARRRLWHALEAMRDGFALFDSSARLVAANSVYLSLFDAASEIGPGATAEELFTVAAEEGAFAIDDDDPDAWVAAQLARWSVDTIAPQVLQTFDGRVIRFQDRRAPDGDIVSLVIDISEDRAREDSLAAARDAAEEVAQAKQAFLARMSHEMRTPMNGVLGLAELLCAQDIDAESHSYAKTIRDSAEALLLIVNDTLDVSRLEADRVTFRHEAFDLEALLCDCLRLAAAGKLAEGVEVALDYPLDAPVMVVGDPGRVRQIVMNLVGNALKFTEAGHVVVRARFAHLGADAAVTIDVEDTGPGIPSDMRTAIFEAFSQVDDGRAQKEGTGLGLTISKGLAERMGGDIAVVDTDEVGACFRLTMRLGLDQEWPGPAAIGGIVAIPPDSGIQGDVMAARLQAAGISVTRSLRGALVLLPSGTRPLPELPAGVPYVVLGARSDVPEAIFAGARACLTLPVTGSDLRAALQPAPGDTLQAPAAPLPTDAAKGAPRILIADDNATNRFLLERMLAQEAYVLDVAKDGAEAVAAYRRTRPDLVLMDISMPVLDGFEAAAAIAALEAERRGTPAPIIALTAHTGEEIGARLTEAGFAAHQTKPVRKDDLLTAMALALAPRTD
ncbi:ATP-binding protein [Jannaschia sp. 2305UL9-9]|uniref:ATP-binding protein n=1 Tax=Jannaschia sp. 2305UL9-9 TaxID=3121638 RepID=UPI003527CBF6